MACLMQLLLPGLLCSWAAAVKSVSPALPTAKCGTPVQVENAEIEISGSTRLRYSCVKDYKRKAGTSSLIVCKQDDDTKQYHWTKADITCIRDPSKPATELPGITEDSRQKTETATPTRESAVPKTSVNAAMVSTRPSGGPTTNSAPASSTTDAVLPVAASPSPDVSVMTAITTEVIRWLSSGMVTENTTLQERSTTQDSWDRTSHQPSFRTPAAQNRSTAVPSRVTAANTVQPPVTDGPDRQTGSPSIQIVLPCLGGVFIILCVLILFYVRLGHLPWHRGVPPEEETPMPVMRLEERGGTSPAASHLDDPGPCNEGAQMLAPHCAPATG